MRFGFLPEVLLMPFVKPSSLGKATEKNFITRGLDSDQTRIRYKGHRENVEYNSRLAPKGELKKIRN